MVERLVNKVLAVTDWSQVVQQYGPIVWKTIHRLLNQEADTADCFQKTFVSAWELSRTEAIRSWPGLLKRLATARAIERLRQRCREAGRLTEMANAAAIPGKEAEPGRAVEAKELAELLRLALAELDPRQADVFCLACLEDMDYREIAERLALTVNHVGVLLHRAKAGLRARLDAHAPSSSTSRTKNEASRD